ARKGLAGESRRLDHGIAKRGKGSQADIRCRCERRAVDWQTVDRPARSNESSKEMLLSSKDREVVRECYKRAVAMLLLALLFVSPVLAQPASKRPPMLRDVGIDQLLNNPVPLDLEFKDETGRPVKLREYFTDKPVLLTLVYYDCPQLCNQVLNGATGALKTLPMTPGKDFIWLTVSFDPREQPELAAAKKDSYLQRLGKPQAAAGWHFLTGSEEAI